MFQGGQRDGPQGGWKEGVKVGAERVTRPERVGVQGEWDQGTERD